MSGLNQNEVKELIEYIQKNNSWETMWEEREKKRRIVKYYQMTVDTRTGDVWAIKFYNIIGAGKDEEVFFRTDKGYNFKDKIYEWLNRERDSEK